jgi:hypothetical protein
VQAIQGEVFASILVQVSTKTNDHFTVAYRLFLTSLHFEVTGQCVQSLDMVEQTS